MSGQLPIACSLSDAELRTREATLPGAPPFAHCAKGGHPRWCRFE